jgi:hypothetical protein
MILKSLIRQNHDLPKIQLRFPIPQTPSMAIHPWSLRGYFGRAKIAQETGFAGFTASPL